MNEELKDKFEEVYAESMWRGDSQVLWDWFKDHVELQNAEIERLKEEYSRLEYKCEYGIWPKPGM